MDSIDTKSSVSEGYSSGKESMVYNNSPGNLGKSLNPNCVHNWTWHFVFQLLIISDQWTHVYLLTSSSGLTKVP